MTTTSICIHHITSIKAHQSKHDVGEFCGPYWSRVIEIRDNMGHTHRLTLFGDTMADLAIEMPAPVALAVSEAA
jgi:hypothetical protein